MSGVPGSAGAPHSMQRQPMPSAMMTGGGMGNSMMGVTGGTALGLRTPATKAGRDFLEKTLGAMALPPDDWADEVRDLHAQLVECLEQLAARERDLRENDELILQYEGSLVQMRQQVACLYAE